MTKKTEMASRFVCSQVSQEARSSKANCPVYKTEKVASIIATGVGRLGFVLLEAGTYESRLESFICELPWLEGRRALLDPDVG